MMPEKNYDNMRKEMANDLRRLANTLPKYQLCNDTGPLYRAAARCEKNKPNGESTWGYNLSELRFNSGKPSGLKPVDVEEVFILLSASLEGNFDCVPHDSFTHLSIDIEKVGYKGGKVTSRGAWHFDRNLEGEAAPEEFHPLYHAHHGGRNLTGKIENYGEVLTMDAPRLLHPPLEGVLAVDFVIANFCPAHWKKISASGEYRRVVLPIYKKIWGGYFGALSSLFAEHGAGIAAFDAVFPIGLHHG